MPNFKIISQCVLRTEYLKEIHVCVVDIKSWNIKYFVCVKKPEKYTYKEM